MAFSHKSGWLAQITRDVLHIGPDYCMRREILIILCVQYWSAIMPLFADTLLDLLLVQLADVVEIEIFLHYH